MNFKVIFFDTRKSIKSQGREVVNQRRQFHLIVFIGQTVSFLDLLVLVKENLCCCFFFPVILSSSEVMLVDEKGIRRRVKNRKGGGKKRNIETDILPLTPPG